MIKGGHKISIGIAVVLSMIFPVLVAMAFVKKSIALIHESSVERAYSPRRVSKPDLGATQSLFPNVSAFGFLQKDINFGAVALGASLEVGVRP